VFVQKIRSLESTYGAIRRARGDGNCFFRSFIFALFEHVLQHRDYDERYRRAQRCVRYVRLRTSCSLSRRCITAHRGRIACTAR